MSDGFIFILFHIKIRILFTIKYTVKKYIFSEELFFVDTIILKVSVFIFLLFGFSNERDYFSGNHIFATGNSKLEINEWYLIFFIFKYQLNKWVWPVKEKKCCFTDSMLSRNNFLSEEVEYFPNVFRNKYLLIVIWSIWKLLKIVFKCITLNSKSMVVFFFHVWQRAKYDQNRFFFLVLKYFFVVFQMKYRKLLYF